MSEIEKKKGFKKLESQIAVIDKIYWYHLCFFPIYFFMPFIVWAFAPEFPIFQFLFIIVSVQTFLYYYRELLKEIVQNTLTKEFLQKTNKTSLGMGLITVILAIVCFFLFVYSIPIDLWIFLPHSVGLSTLFWCIMFVVLSILFLLPILLNHIYKKYLNGNITQEIAK
jgi:hypothetical protein